jgi:2-iminobutanoate/2-iminopropanoate deaminase
MPRELRPAGLAPPAANYAHAVLSEGPSRWVHTSGVVPTAPDGTVPDGLANQAEQVWSTITALLHEGGLELADIVSVTTYVVAGRDLGVVMATRDRVLGAHRTASTLIVVPQLAQPAWHLEIAVVACR